MSEQPEIEEAEGMEPVSIATRWGTIGHLGAQGVRLVAFFVLLSMMGRDEFGVFEAALFVTGLAEMIRLAGLPEFLIQARELPARLLASVFWLNLIVAFAMSGVLWLSAGPIAVALNEPRAASLISWLGLAFPVLALTQVHEALLRRQLRFGALAAAQIAGPVAYMVAAVPLAAYGYGPTAFIWGTLADVGVTTFVLWTVCEFRPKGGFRLGDARSAYGFSLALTAADIVHWVTSMSDRAIVLLFFGTKALGVYGTARRLLLQLAKPLTLIYAKVGYPALVACANDAEALRSRYLRALGGVALLTFPGMAVLAVLAGPFVALLNNAEWDGTVPLIRVFAPVTAVLVVASTVGAIYKVRARTGLLLLWNLGSGTLLLGSYLFGAKWGPTGIAVTSTAVVLLLLWPAFAIPCGLIGLRAGQALRVLVTPLLIGVITGAAALVAAASCAAFEAGSKTELVAGLVVAALAFPLLAFKLRPTGLEDLIAVVARRRT